MHNVGTVPTYKMHNVGTVPTFKMHNIGTPNFYYFFSLNLDCMAKINDRSLRPFFYLSPLWPTTQPPSPFYVSIRSIRHALFKKWHFKTCLAFPHYYRKVASMFQWPGPMFAASSFLPHSAPTWSIRWSFIIAMFIFYMSPHVSQLLYLLTPPPPPNYSQKPKFYIFFWRQPL